MKNPGHILSSIPILIHKDLLIRLNNLVTLKPECMITKYSGFPPHISMTVYFRDILKTSQDVLIEVRKIDDNVKIEVSDVFEKKALENVHVTQELIQKILNEEMDKMSNIVGDHIHDLKCSISNIHNDHCCEDITT